VLLYRAGASDQCLSISSSVRFFGLGNVLPGEQRLRQRNRAQDREGRRLPEPIQGGREQQDDDRIRDPLRQHRHDHRRAAHVRGQDLRHQRPEDGADARSEKS
jgi:hypothetical protein